MESVPQRTRLSDEAFDEQTRFNTTTKKNTPPQIMDSVSDIEPDSVRPTTADSRRVKDHDNRSTYSSESASDNDEASQHQNNNGANSPYDPSPVHNDDVHHYDTENITMITNSFQKLSVPSAQVENDDSVIIQHSSSKSPMNNVASITAPRCPTATPIR